MVSRKDLNTDARMFRIRAAFVENVAERGQAPGAGECGS
jgi:hypothetical protein